MDKEEKLRVLYKRKADLEKIIRSKEIEESTESAEDEDFINPFTNRSMIKTEHEFVGRSREIDDIITRLHNANSVSIVGERRIGKSSLLYHLYLTGKRRLNNKTRYNYQFVYLDMHNPLMKTPENFVRKTLQELNIKYREEQIKELAMIEFSEALELNSKSGNMPVLLLDEFESLTKKKELFNDDFINGLRSFCNNGLMVIISASKISLKEITKRGDLTSPFWNIFATIELAEFVIDHNLNEVDEFVDNYWISLHQTESEKEFLYTYSKRHPLIIQIISYWLLKNRTLLYDIVKLKKEIENELNSFFLNYKDSIL